MSSLDDFLRSLDDENEGHAALHEAAPDPRPETIDPSSAFVFADDAGEDAGEDGSDVQLWRLHFGPDEAWTRTPEDADDAADRAARLVAADDAAASLRGDAIHVVASCPLRGPNRAMEVELVDDGGRPAADLLVELQCKEQQGAITLKSDAAGEVRFEGLVPTETHSLRVVGAAWSIESRSPLPEDAAQSSWEAVWSAPPAAFGKRSHEVQQGECLWTIATRYGQEQDALWQANPALHEGRRTRNVLASGDVVALLSAEPRSEPVRPGERVRLRCKPAEARARVRFLNADGRARAGVDFVATLTTDGGPRRVWKGKTSGDGAIDEAVPADATALEVELVTTPEPEVHHFRFAYLDPLETTSGLQGRLLNLGFWCGSERGEVGPLTRRALREFQRKHGVPESGASDEPTRSKLAEIYGD